MIFLSKVSLLLSAVATTHAASGINAPDNVPEGPSVEHDPSFSSISVEPAFWVEFAVDRSWITAGDPAQWNRHGQHVLDPAGGDIVRTMGHKGEIYRTTVGPNYFKSWSNFPPSVSLISTLNFGSNKLDAARDLAVASVKYQADRVKYLDLGNEPNHYPKSRWNLNTANYAPEALQSNEISQDR
ncbi:glycoside hydrolase family 79 [Fusarium sp. NRRL 52700]|nr:glycoside hydrolase family 79 [Fusarium sp. NRRL 52700]